MVWSVGSEAAIGRRGAWNRIPAFGAWLTSTILLAAAIVVAFILMSVREPPVVIRDGPVPLAPPPSPEMLADVERLGDKAEAVSDEIRRMLHGIGAYACPAGTSPSDPGLFRRLRLEAESADGPA